MPKSYEPSIETILLAWNPKKYPWGDLKHELAAVRRDGHSSDRWSVGNRKNLIIGSRFFLIRLGENPKGLVGSGFTTSVPSPAPHWDADRALRGDSSNYSEIMFDVLEEEPLISMSELQSEPFDAVHWSTQMSGITIAQDVAAAVEFLWNQRSSDKRRAVQDELDLAGPIVAKHGISTYVNRYERSARARALCLAHYGLRCAACDVLLSDVYGPSAKHVIHVHHLSPLADVPEGYTIDPVNDLRPLCPNCHSVAHTRREPYSIKEIKAMLHTNRKA